MPLTRIRQTSIGVDAITTAKLDDTSGGLTLPGVQFVKVSAGTTAQRPSSAAGGQIRFNTDIGTLEQYNTTTSSWQAIDSPPIITSLAYSGSVTAADTAGGDTITLTGSNFKAGATVTIGGTSASSVTVVSSSSVTFTTPAKTAGDYDVTVTNTNGLAATLTSGISYNGSPSFTTAAGNVGSVIEDVTMSTITIVAAEPDGGTLAYSITSGALPTGVSMSSGGAITGKANVNITSNTTYNFTVTATDDENQTNARAFNLIVLRPIYATEIANSLMFNDGSNDHLSFTPSSAGNQDMWTLSMWVKRGLVSVSQILFGARSGTNFTQLYFNGSDKLTFNDWSGSQNWGGESASEFKDQSAWYHLTLTYDSAQATAANRYKMYVNGTQQTVSTLSGYPSTYPDQNEDSKINSTYEHAIGQTANVVSDPFDGIMADIYFIDGQALSPTSFAEEYNGVWTPIAPYSGSYGTNGWHLNFANSSDIGNDVSGQNNDWTPDVGTNRVRPESPTNNFCGLVGTSKSTNLTSNVGNGNTYIATPNNGSIMGSFDINKGKWYWEVKVTNTGAPYIGVQRRGENRNGYTQGAAAVNAAGDIYFNQSWPSPNLEGLPSISVNDIIGVAVDHDNTKMWFSKNGQWYEADATNGNTSTLTISQVAAGNNGYDYSVIFQPNELNDMNVHPHFASSSGTGAFQCNFGQNPSFNSLESSLGTETDGNGQGLFKYPVPSGFLALCQKNLTQETSHTIELNERPQNYFNTLLYTGNATARNITGLDFQPDLVWIREYAGSGTMSGSMMHDSVRGAGKRISWNAVSEELDRSTEFTSFNSNGFGLGTSDTTNETNNSIAAWCWKAGGAPTATNSAGVGNAPTSGSVMIDGSASTAALAGTIAADKISANTKSGFSIVKYTGNGNGNTTVAHGLTKRPDVVVVKNLDTTENWVMWHQSNNTEHTLYPNLVNAHNNSPNTWYEPGMSATTFGVDTAEANSANNMIAYCWHSVPGYSLVGEYVGNGSTSGSYVHCGFKPAMVIMKSHGSGGWMLWDNKREPNNPQDLRLELQGTSVHSSNAAYKREIYSNGFRLRTTSSEWNGSGVRYIFMAFAEDSFKYAEGR
jgi:hypothetical protein